MKIKNIKLTLFFVILILTLLVIPNMCKATTINATETTMTSTGKIVKWSYELNSNNEIINLLCTNKDTISGGVTIPSTIDGKKVVELGKDEYSQGTFEQCSGLTSITIPNTVTTIGYQAFYKCIGLTSLIIPDSVTSICKYSFRGCSGIKNLTLSKNLTSIKDQTFEDCTGLINVIIPDSVTTIEGEYSNIYGAFGGCENLTKVLIPDSVASIGIGAFRDCTKLTIYGNDNQKSKEYAEENKIKFDYISNWNKANSGIDITAPTVEKMLIKYSSILSYWDITTNTHRIPTGGIIQIVVEFSEDIKGTTVPTLKIKCGEGIEREITTGAITGKNIVYNYTIKSDDVGVIASKSYTGGNITDNSGNKSELSCPCLYVQYGTKEYAYANGTNAKVNSNEQKQEKNKENNILQNQQPTNLVNKDTTIKPDSKLPQTGISILLLICISVLIIAIISKIKCNKYKEI